MICSKLINSLAIVFMLEFAGMAMADFPKHYAGRFSEN